MLDATEVNTSDNNRARNFFPSKHFVSVLWGAFTKQLRKLLASWCPSVGTMEFAAVPCGGSFMKFHIWGTNIYRRISVLVTAGQYRHILYAKTYVHFQQFTVTVLYNRDSVLCEKRAGAEEIVSNLYITTKYDNCKSPRWHSLVVWKASIAICCKFLSTIRRKLTVCDMQQVKHLK